MQNRYIREEDLREPIGGEMALREGATKKNAYASKWNLYLGDATIHLTGYNIGGCNYYKLRDLGQTLIFRSLGRKRNKRSAS